MGTKQRRAREKEELRQEILDAARELFVKEGYENVSMRRIAEKIEYSPTTIYLYFEDKASLLHAICEETFARLANRTEAIRKQYPDPLDGLRRGCRAYVDFGLKHPNHYRVTFMTPPPAGLAKEHYMREDSQGMRAYNCLREGVSGCIDQGLFREKDPEAVTQMLWSAIHGVTSLLITKPAFPWVGKNALIDLMIDNAIRGLRA